MSLELNGIWYSEREDIAQLAQNIATKMWWTAVYHKFEKVLQSMSKNSSNNCVFISSTKSFIFVDPGNYQRLWTCLSTSWQNPALVDVAHLFIIHSLHVTIPFLVDSLFYSRFFSHQRLSINLTLRSGYRTKSLMSFHSSFAQNDYRIQKLWVRPLIIRYDEE